MWLAEGGANAHMRKAGHDFADVTEDRLRAPFDPGRTLGYDPIAFGVGSSTVHQSDGTPKLMFALWKAPQKR